MKAIGLLLRILGYISAYIIFGFPALVCLTGLVVGFLILITPCYLVTFGKYAMEAKGKNFAWVVNKTHAEMF